MLPNEPVSERSRRLISLIEAEGVHYGREDSFKMSDAGLQARRFLMGIPTRDLAPDRTLGLCHALGMPERLRATFAEHLPHANMLGVGLDDGPAAGVYKVYLEFWDKVVHLVRQTKRTAPLLLHLGFKWQAGGDGAEGRITRYTCFPLLSLHDILARIEKIHQGAATLTVQTLTTGIIRHAATSNPGVSFLYIEADEEGDPRRSFDIKLYKSGLTIGDIEPYMRALGRHYCLPDSEYLPLLSQIGHHLLGHLSGGLNPAGKEATTLYYETRAFDP